MALFGGKRRHKYNARKTICIKRHEHPSGLEAGVCNMLTAKEQAGEISDVKYIHSVDLGFSIRWKIDFSYQAKNGERVFVEAKGQPDATYRLKLRMWRNGAAVGRLEIWRGSYARVFLSEAFDL